MSVGRLDEMDLQLDPNAELSVSRRHAVFEWIDGRWSVRDLGSQNGTFVNGERVWSGTALSPGDRIQFGTDGPVVEFTHGAPLAASYAAGLSAGVHGRAPASQAAASGAAPGINTGEVRVRVARETRRLRVLVGALAVGIVALSVVSLYTFRKNQQVWEADARAMRLQIDSILVESGKVTSALAGRAEGLTAALASTEEQLRDVQRRLATSTGNSRGEVEALRRDLLNAQAALMRQQLAATLDYEAIEQSNRRAVAKLYVEFPGGNRFTGSAFAVRSSGVLVTSRHLVQREGGGGPTRIGVQFDNSRQVYPARVIAVAPDDDLALLQMERLRGTVPTVAGLAPESRALSAGSAVAMIGFPLGGITSPTAGAQEPAEAIVVAGVVSGYFSGRLEVDGYGAEGASGSPFFDADGQVIAVLYGGRTADGRRILHGVTVDRVVGLLER